MHSITACHPNRPALLRCYINRVTSPLHLPSFLGPPNGRRLMSTRNFIPCFLLPPPDPPCSQKHLLQHRGLQSGLNRLAKLYYPIATYSHPLLLQCQKHPKSLMWHHKQGVPQKTALTNASMCVLRKWSLFCQQCGCCEKKVNKETSFVYSVITRKAANRIQTN